MVRSRATRPLLRRLVAVVLATPVHLVSIGMAALGIWLAWSGTSAWLGVVVVLLAIMLVWRPLRSRLDLRTAPHTDALLRRIAAAVDAPLPRRFMVVRSYSAESRSDVHGRTLCVGAPLWLALDGDERVALLARTLAPRGSARSRSDAYVDHALGTLDRWQRTLTPDATPDPLSVYDPVILTSEAQVITGRAQFRLGLDVAWVLLWPLRAIVGGYRRILAAATAPLREAREQRVDEVTAAVAGPRALAALRRELGNGNAVSALIQRAANTGADMHTAVAERTARIAATDAGALLTTDPDGTVYVRPDSWVLIEQEWQGAVAEQFEQLRSDYR
jgi:hypothetical protein